ncbi:tellurite resistance TerB family protein [Salinimonas chungwhensis]|uniref:tellurite resistance TerB family protein n=1 Tax=Salinimonas chungwhensis TaxID=265425 RepID=UPI00037A76A5|nr:TerB family tellurite resistance protein [Salinimonas chungwhensis]
MQLSNQQSFNQALIRLAVLLYQIDNKVTLTEQDYLEEMVDSLLWESPICREAFLNDVIYQTRKALDTGAVMTYLREFKDDLEFDAHRAMEVAMAITGVDGNRSDEETEILSLLTHKMLAKALTSNSQPPSQSVTAS